MENGLIAGSLYINFHMPCKSIYWGEYT